MLKNTYGEQFAKKSVSIFFKLLFASRKGCLACGRVLSKMVILHFSVHVETLLNPGCVVP